VIKALDLFEDCLSFYATRQYKQEHKNDVLRSEEGNLYMNNYLKILTGENVYERIPATDVISKQQYSLFKIFSFSGSIVCMGVFSKMMITIEHPGVLPYIILSLAAIMLVNFYAARNIEKLQRAYVIMLVSACLLLHTVAYDCGGIRTGGSMYYTAIVIYAYMLLGKRLGGYFTIGILCQLTYLFLISQYTDWTSFKMFNNDDALINEDYIVNISLTVFLVANLSKYLQSRKNVVTQKLEQDQLELEKKNCELEEKNIVLREYSIRLENKNRDLEKFISIASHDLRSPLRAVGSLSGIIREETEKSLPELLPYFETIKGRLTRMDNLLDALLNYTKMETIHEIVESQSVEIILHQVISQIHPEDDVSINIEKGMPNAIGCSNKLQKVLYQIINNAILHNDKSDKRIDISFSSNNNSCYLKIHDNGPGIEEKYNKKVFEIFQTLQRRDEKETMGIGLAIAKKIIADMGGAIHLNSTIGEGSTFAIDLPVRYFEATSVNVRAKKLAILHSN
jgi:signal transduction histidine kinase